MDAALVELAGAYGVATSYWDWQGRLVHVDPDVVVAVLGVLGVDATIRATTDLIPLLRWWAAA